VCFSPAYRHVSRQHDSFGVCWYVRGGIIVDCCASYVVLIQYLVEVEVVPDSGDHVVSKEGGPVESTSVRVAYQRRIHAHGCPIEFVDRVRDSFPFIWVLQSAVFAFAHKMASCVVFGDPFTHYFHDSE
jgi:hypothetical protein